jgi:hypothetical protein
LWSYDLRWNNSAKHRKETKTKVQGFHRDMPFRLSGIDSALGALQDNSSFVVSGTGASLSVSLSVSLAECVCACCRAELLSVHRDEQAWLDEHLGASLQSQDVTIKGEVNGHHSYRLAIPQWCIAFFGGSFLHGGDSYGYPGNLRVHWCVHCLSVLSQPRSD